MIKLCAPAKVNLHLHITGQRDDGYHYIDSIMGFTQWGDDITITPADQLTFTVDGPYAHIFNANDDMQSLEPDSKNHIIRAVHLMAKQANKSPDIHIHLTKNIPVGAGLGGGSSDAATVMNALNEMWDMGLGLDDLCQIGLQLGAELPVCLHKKPCHVTGIGEIIKPIDYTVSTKSFVIVWPDQELLTAGVFHQFRSMPHKDTIISIGHDKFNLEEDCYDYIAKTSNDLTGAAIELCPEVATILSDLMDCYGCILSRMSGSGSSCFGVFETIEQAEHAAKQFKNAVVTHIVNP